MSQLVAALTIISANSQGLDKKWLFFQTGEKTRLKRTGCGGRGMEGQRDLSVASRGPKFRGMGEEEKLNHWLRGTLFPVQAILYKAKNGNVEGLCLTLLQVNSSLHCWPLSPHSVLTDSILLSHHSHATASIFRLSYF